ncbi:SPOR domain-containing protein [Helicobacter cetorum]|uniref:SPOR domain-containing protein n=1 Tax=Helicobacter cetorum (strain ATCC BAA-540 / CCUG 52418 / MIT 99-5656) TaxID=1163745 RepID=I0ERP8_HELCM|nr:SPOR domain-containing protein [Helicobacter cetorum]AFI05617.1 hypothetical protein HCD_03005 [Helicobacter cetorum MIT 99-5656]
MQEKERLNDVILEEESSGGGAKKALLIVAIAIIVLAVLLMVFWKSTRTTPKETFLQTDSGMQKIGNTKDEKKDDEFENLNLEFPNNPQQEDRLDKLADDVKNQDRANLKMQSDETKAPSDTPNNKGSEPNFIEHTSKLKKMPKQEAKQNDKKPAQTDNKKASKQAHTKHSQQEKGLKKPVKQEAKKPKNTAMPKSYYLQVGVFAHTPNKAFLQEFEKFAHKIEKGKANTKYLIGPYKTRQEALEHANEVTKKLTKPIIVKMP